MNAVNGLFTISLNVRQKSKRKISPRYYSYTPLPISLKPGELYVILKKVRTVSKRFCYGYVNGRWPAHVDRNFKGVRTHEL